MFSQELEFNKELVFYRVLVFIQELDLVNTQELVFLSLVLVTYNRVLVAFNQVLVFNKVLQLNKVLEQFNTQELVFLSLELVTFNQVPVFNKLLVLNKVLEQAMIPLMVSSMELVNQVLDMGSKLVLPNMANLCMEVHKHQVLELELVSANPALVFHNTVKVHSKLFNQVKGQYLDLKLVTVNLVPV